ncbi:MAG TPA: carbonate dehydratase [Cytophagaceae bacterium]|jgi:carbonic anhydrase|nr:carbonate dehydratase [Cytophagaceae bacterium]
MNKHLNLLSGNKSWASSKVKEDPEFFLRLKAQQRPEYLWIGCSDSRVPANEVTGTQPGDIFVHRNIANLVIHTDMNLLSVLDYAVTVLHVKHIIVCGHYGCGGVRAAMDSTSYGFVDSWLRNIKDVYNKHIKQLEAIEDMEKRCDLLVELTVVEQVRNLAKTKIVQRAWKDKELQIHGWVYGLEDGIIKDLNVVFEEVENIERIYRYDNL